MRLSSLFFALICVLLGSCGGGGGSGSKTTPPPPPPPPTNSAPIFTSGAVGSAPENQLGAYSAAATDADAGDTVTFAISGGADAALFNIDANSGVVEFSGAAPDFESPADTDGDNVYQITFSASDGTDTITLDVDITVTDVSQLTIAVHFPIDGANLAGDQTTTSVSGGLSDVEDGVVLSDDVANMTANGVDVVQDPNDPSSWSVEVPVVEGNNVLNVAVESRSGDQDAKSLSVDNSLLFLRPFDVVVDSANQRLIVLDGARLVVADLAVGTLGVGASSTTTAMSSRLVAVDYDEVNGRALAYRGYPLELWASALGGVWSPTISINNPRNIRDSRLAGLVVDASGQNAFFLESRVNPDAILYSMDLASGDLTTISGGAIGSAGPGMFAPKALAVDEANGRAIVADPGLDQILGVNLTTGARSLLSDSNLAFPLAETVVREKNDLVADLATERAAFTYFDLGFVMEINLTTGARSELSGASRGVGPSFEYPLGMSFDDSSGQLYVTDIRKDAVFRVEMSTGDRTVLFDPGRGTGPGLVNPRSIRLDVANNRLLVVDFNVKELFVTPWESALYAVDISTGDRQLLSGEGVGGGPAFEGSRDFDTNFRENRILALSGKSVIEIDLTSGIRSTISSDTVGIGPALDILMAIAVDPVNDRAFVIDNGLLAILEVDLVTGNRTIVADNSVGSGRQLVFPREIVYDPIGDQVFVFDSGPYAIVSIDLSTGNRSIVSGDGVGAGPELATASSLANSLALDFESETLILNGFEAGLIAVDIASGNRGSLSLPVPSAIENTLNFMPAWDIAYDESRNRVFACTEPGRIRVIDLKSGLTAVISD